MQDKERSRYNAGTARYSLETSNESEKQTEKLHAIVRTSLLQLAGNMARIDEEGWDIWDAGARASVQLSRL